MNIPIAITGLGLLSPLDAPGVSTWDAICAGRRVEKQRTVRDDLLQQNPDLDRSIRLALAAARQAYPGGPCALFCGTSKGPVATWLAALEQLRRGEELSRAQALHVALGTGAMGALLRQRLAIPGNSGESPHTSVAACASGMFALHKAAQAIARGECRRALVVAADASLHPLFEGSFDRLGVLAPLSEDGLPRCEPFRENGQGFFLIEAAAAVFLEAGAASTVMLDDSWIGADSTALVAIDPATRALRTGLTKIASTPAAFVHAHATGTAHDAYELAAIRATLGPNIPVFSHKKYLGHSLGAAGLLSVVISALCHQHRRTPAGSPLPPAARSLTIAQGFGGHIGLVTLRGHG